MIGVIANEADQPVVEEFFQLFKTPWRYYEPNLKCDVLISFDAVVPESVARVILVYGGRKNALDEERGVEVTSGRANSVLSYKGKRIPLYGDCVTFRSASRFPLIEEASNNSALVEVECNDRSVLRLGYDLFQEVRYLLSRGQPLGNAAIPTLELHIALLRDLVLTCGIPVYEIPPVPTGYNFTACLTHDVDHIGIRNHKLDHTFWGFLYRATIGSLIDLLRGRKSPGQVATNFVAVISLPFVYLGLARDFWSRLDRYLEIEKGIPSTFFIIPRPNDPGQDALGRRRPKRAARYNLGEIRSQLERLVASRCEIGVHGIDAWRDEHSALHELEVLRKAVAAPVTGSRMHWLFFDEGSPVVLEKAGFTYDSTFGFNETVGYRAGLAQAYKPVTVEHLLELPLHIMDTALFYPSHMNLSPRRAATLIDTLLDDAVQLGGVLTINWHDRSIVPERLWDGFYLELLEKLRKRGARCATASECVAWFRRRRSVVFADFAGSDREGDTVRLEVDQDEGPALRLRRHRPSSVADSSFANDFDEVTLNSSGEFTFDGVTLRAA